MLIPVKPPFTNPNMNANLDVYSARCESTQRVWSRCADLEVGLTAYRRPVSKKKPIKWVDDRTYKKNPESAVFGGPEAKKVMDELEQHGMNETQALVVFTAIAAALGLGGTGATVAQVGLGLMAEGLAAHTIQIVVLTTATGTFVTLTGIGMIAIGITLMIITLNVILPKVEKPSESTKTRR